MLENIRRAKLLPINLDVGIVAVEQHLYTQTHNTTGKHILQSNTSYILGLPTKEIAQQLAKILHKQTLVLHLVYDTQDTNLECSEFVGVVLDGVCSNPLQLKVITPVINIKEKSSETVAPTQYLLQ